MGPSFLFLIQPQQHLIPPGNETNLNQGTEGNTLFPFVLPAVSTTCSLQLMDYRSILKEQLQSRQELNSSYSLRAFAKKLELSPSKLSEVISGKKRLSSKRAEDVVNKLELSDNERELFVLSAQIESSAKGVDKKDLQQQIQSLAQQINAKKTTQRNAWYFGAINALEELDHNPLKFKAELGLTDLQVENAKRFRNRIQRFYPERKQFTFEPLSVLKKIETKCFTKESSPLDADFVFLTEAQTQELHKKIKSYIRTLKSKNKNSNPEDLSMVFWGSINVINK